MANSTLTELCKEAGELGVSSTEFWNQVNRHEWAQEDMLAAAQETLADIRSGGINCLKCGGSGVFHYRDGRTGDCYQCDGKGYESPKDMKRNFGYRKYHPTHAARYQRQASRSKSS